MAVDKNALPELNKEGNRKYFDEAAENMNIDQMYREYIKNSIEACQRMKDIDPNFKGEIIVEEDKYFPGKLSIIDNGIGFKADTIVKLIKDISTTEEQSKDGNYGMGAKISAFANNRAGIIYTSLRHDEDEGSRCLNCLDEKDNYSVQHDDDYNSCRIPVPIGEMHPLIQKHGHGTQVTLLGQSMKENTMTPPEDYAEQSMLGKSRKDSVYWLLAYLNTKFFKVPDFITIKVILQRKDRDSFERCYGHDYYLKNYSRKKGYFRSENAGYHWWILQETDGTSNRDKRLSRSECVLNAQVAYMNRDEVMEIEWNQRGKVAPHKLWGLHYSHQHVAIVVDLFNHKPNQYRTTLTQRRKDFNKIKNEIRDYFMENMPVELRELERELQEKHAQADAMNLINAKEMAKLLKGFTLEDQTGLDHMDNMNLQGGAHLRDGASNPEPVVNTTPGPIPGPLPGTKIITAGLSDPSGKKRAKKATTPNPMPKVEWVDESIQESWVSYDWSEHEVRLRKDSPWLKKIADWASKKSGTILPEASHEYAKNVFNEEVSNRIAFIRFSDVGYSEEEKKVLLGDESLTAVLLDPLGLPAKVVEKSKNLMKSQFEMEKAKEEVEAA